MTEDHIGRGDMVRLSGVGHDVLTFWLRAGLIRPVIEPSGDKKRLKFDPLQVNVAGVLAAARLAGVNVDGLKAIAATLQRALADFRAAGVEPNRVSALIEEMQGAGTLRENAPKVQMLAERQPDNDRLAKLAEFYRDEAAISRVEVAAANFAGPIESLWTAQQIIDSEGLAIIYREAEAAPWVVEIRGTFDENQMSAPHALVINLRRCIRPRATEDLAA